MPIPKSIATAQAALRQAREILLRYQPVSRQREALFRLMQSTHDWNIACGLKAYRYYDKPEAPPAFVVWHTIMVNLDQATRGEIAFSAPVEEGFEIEMIQAAYAIREAIVDLFASS